MTHPGRSCATNCHQLSYRALFTIFIMVSLAIPGPAVAAVTPVTWTHLTSSNGDLPVPPASDGQVTLKVHDFDMDGQNDYVMSFWQSAQTLIWYRHVGNKFEPYVVDTDRQDLSHGEGFHDIDGDGDIDLIISDAGQGNQIYWWENPYPNYDPNTPWVRRTVYTGPQNMFHDSIWGDFDGDGVDEFIAWNQFAYQLLMFEVPADPKTSGPWPATQMATQSANSKSVRSSLHCLVALAFLSRLL